MNLLLAVVSVTGLTLPPVASTTIASAVGTVCLGANHFLAPAR